MKPKFLFSIVLLSFSFCALRAQDIITLKSGEEIQAKIVEIESSDVKYRKFDNQQGPIYTLLKSDIFMIKYENGTKDIFGNTSPAARPDESNNNYNSNNNNSEQNQNQEGTRNVNSYDANMKLYKHDLVNGIVLTSLGPPLLVAGIAMTAWAANDYASFVPYSYDTYDINGYYLGTVHVTDPPNADTDFGVMAVGAGLATAGLVMTIVGPIRLGSAVKYKRLANQAKAYMSFEPAMLRAPGSPMMGSACGIGMKIHF